MINLFIIPDTIIYATVMQKNNNHISCWNRNTSNKLCQYHDFWYTGPLCHQIISNISIDYALIVH